MRWRSACYSSASYACAGRGELRRELTLLDQTPRRIEMTERDDLLSSLSDASERLAALRGYL
ncbi:MAG: hypothetical protein DMF54_09005 [Acidobacteria bacterium]|nr:MAG: hypothetical protein DMF54_09005 [Acidobacteriota bacterium]